MPHKYLLKEFEDFARSAANSESLMGHVSQRTHAHIPRYNWVGFYLIDKRDSAMLVLGPHTGSFTPQHRISVNQGLCGLAASTLRVIVADDVSQEPHYLQTSDMVKSQISVPIQVRDNAAAVFNVESYFMAAFKSPQERDFVEACAKLVGRSLEKTLAGEFVSA
jgi:GAF domain-containing protein